uniref:Uncharacterized protein n=2 Tax=Brassica oleracea TaxID=3712 RepID=A0A0D3E1K8_BRAOL|nr:unnamed protein product [Brassica oleracea]
MSFSELITLRFPVPLLQIQICHLPHYPPFLVLLLEPEDEHEAQLDLNNPLEPKEPKPDLNDPVEPEESEPDLNPFANFPLGTFPSDLICWIERRACSLPTLAKYHSIGYSESFVDDMPQEGVVGVVFNFSYEIVRTRVRVVHICGDVSAFIANLTSLQRVKLSKNQLRFDLSKLKLPEGVSSVDLSSNLVTGSLSSLLNSKTSWFLEEAHLSNNQISGRIPDFSECLNVKVLNIGNNKIGGQIPSSISNLFELVRLDISRNHITGVIPQGLGHSSSSTG